MTTREQRAAWWLEAYDAPRIRLLEMIRQLAADLEASERRLAEYAREDGLDELRAAERSSAVEAANVLMDALGVSAGGLTAMAIEVVRRLRASEQQAAGLRAALNPFAMYADKLGSYLDSQQVGYFDGITVADCRRARAALAGQPPAVISDLPKRTFAAIHAESDAIKAECLRDAERYCPRQHGGGWILHCGLGTSRLPDAEREQAVRVVAEIIWQERYGKPSDLPARARRAAERIVISENDCEDEALTQQYAAWILDELRRA